MQLFTLHLQDSTKYERVEDVVSFVGQDKTGKFGLMANHGRIITTLNFGLAKYKIEGENWTYIALPGGVLHFVNNALYISTRQFLVDEDYDRICDELENQIRREEVKTRSVRQSLYKMEREMFKRLGNLGRLEM